MTYKPVVYTDNNDGIVKYLLDSVEIPVSIHVVKGTPNSFAWALTQAFGVVVKVFSSVHIPYRKF